jgi:hypothetical protein
MFGDGRHSSVFVAGKTTVTLIPRMISSSGLRWHVHDGMDEDGAVGPWMVQGSNRRAGMRGNVMMACGDGAVAVAAELARVPGSCRRRRAGVWRG